MSIAHESRILALEARCAALEKRLAEVEAEEDPEADDPLPEPPYEREKRRKRNV